MVIATAASSTPRSPPPFSASAILRALDLTRAGLAAQLPDELEHLS